MHRDIITAYPTSVIALAHTPTCSTQGMYVPRRMISVQGHPEYTEEMVREILDWFQANDAIDGDILADSLRRVGHRNDGVEIAKSFLRFLQE